MANKGFKVDIAADLFDWLSQSKLKGESEIIPQSLYDTIELPAAAITAQQEVKFFDVVTGKGLSETNLVKPHELEVDNYFVAQGINVFFPLPPVQAELEKIYGAKPFIRIKFTNKVFVEVPLVQIPNGYGWTSNNASPSWGGFNVAGSKSFEPFNVFFDNLQRFEVTMIFDGTSAALAAAVQVQCAFDGYQIRPVQ